MFSRASVAFCIVLCCELGATVGETDRFIPLVQAEIVQYEGLPIRAFARIVRNEVGRTVESFSMPLSPGDESKSVLLLDFSDEAVTAEIVCVSPTSPTTLELTFRNEDGELALGIW